MLNRTAISFDTTLAKCRLPDAFLQFPMALLFQTIEGSPYRNSPFSAARLVSSGHHGRLRTRSLAASRLATPSERALNLMPRSLIEPPDEGAAYMSAATNSLR